MLERNEIEARRRETFGAIFWASIVATAVLATACRTGLTAFADPDNGSGTPAPFTVMTGGTLAAGFNEGIDTSGHVRNWITATKDYVECAYPKDQQWGALFITQGAASSDPTKRNAIDVSKYHYLVVDLAGAKGGEQVSVGIKSPTDIDDGLEPKFVADKLTTDFKTFRIPLTSLVNDANGYPPSRLHHVYVVCELVFEPTDPAETVRLRNVHFE